MQTGITLAESNLENILKIRDQGLLDFVEIVPSFYFRYNKVKELKNLLAKVELPYSFHFIDHSPLSENFNKDKVLQTRDALEHFEPIMVSDHLTAMEEDFSIGMNFPTPICSKYIDQYTENIIFMRENFEKVVTCPIIMEHVPRYFTYKSNDISLSEFLNTLCENAGIGILLDLNNLTCDQHNIDQSIQAVIDQLEHKNIKEIHMAGSLQMDNGLLYDSHAANPDENQYRFLEQLRDLDIIVNYEREKDFDYNESITCLEKMNEIKKG